MSPQRAAFNADLRDLQREVDRLTGAHNARVYERGARVERDYRREALERKWR